MAKARVTIELSSALDDYTRQDMSEAYAYLAYHAIDKIYGREALYIRQNIKRDKNKLSVDDFLASALLTGKEAYDLKAALTSSNRTKISKTGEKYLAVPVGNEVKTMTSTSNGWKHPGFSAANWEHFVRLLEEIDILTILSQTR